MSLTNPNTVVTEQRLSEFYQGILPYLGGMPEMLANKFSKGDLYSTEEKMIGQWIDGKPLYQKIISCGALPNSTNKDVPHGISDIDVIVSIKGVGIFNNGTTLSLPVVYEQLNESFNTKIAVDKTNISFINSGDRSNITTTYVTLQYTKTTDTAISIGSDTDYSTEEKIVGTWIDSKPLYQKVFNCGDNVTDGKTIALNLDNPAFVKIECFAAFGSASMPVPTIDSATNYISFYYQSSTGNLVFKKAGTSWTQYTVYAIVQYTKTTD